MNKKAFTSIFIDTKHNKLKKEFVKLASTKFILTDKSYSADIIIADKETETDQLQIIIDESETQKNSFDRKIYFQPCFNRKCVDINLKAQNLFQYVLIITYQYKLPHTKNDTTILLL